MNKSDTVAFLMTFSPVIILVVAFLIFAVPAGFKAISETKPCFSDNVAEITLLREENARLREALLFAELMASEIGIDPREKCQRIYDELYKIRTAATAIQDGGNNDPE